MGFLRLISRLLSIFVIAGLVAAPLVRPVAAAQVSAAAMPEMASMADDMPCCPDRQKNKDCKDCPLLAICVVKILAANPAADAIAVHSDRHLQLVIYDDLMSDGVDCPPPDHPPRTLV
ncbi:MAG: hypothetical protein WBF99_16175 [Xanthobacteraceae bacterium]